MLDLGNYDLAAAFRLDGCPLCRVLSEGEIRAMDAFIEESLQLAEPQRVFCDHGGFCRDHAWLFHRRAALAVTGLPVARMYEALLRRDIGRLERLESDLASGIRRRDAPKSMLGRAPCPLCDRGAERSRAKVRGLIAALEESRLRDVYLESDGLCMEHLDVVGAQALVTSQEVASFLIRDLRRRLHALEERLVAYERSLDYRSAKDRTARDADAWTDVVRSYVGDPFAIVDG